jgi:hypothetical protein
MESSLGFPVRTDIHSSSILKCSGSRFKKGRKLFKKSGGKEATGSKLAKHGATDAGRNLRVENERESSVQKLVFTLYDVALDSIDIEHCSFPVRDTLFKTWQAAGRLQVSTPNQGQLYLLLHCQLAFLHSPYVQTPNDLQAQLNPA